MQVDQLTLASETLNIAKNKHYKSFAENYKRVHLKKKIKSKLTEFYTSRKKTKPLESYEILALWRDYVLDILEKKKVKPENQARKEETIKDLKSLNSQDMLDESDLRISITRDILLLLWEESSDKQKSRFIDIIRTVKIQTLENLSKQLCSSDLLDGLYEQYLMSKEYRFTEGEIDVILDLYRYGCQNTSNNINVHHEILRTTPRNQFNRWQRLLKASNQSLIWLEH